MEAGVEGGACSTVAMSAGECGLAWKLVTACALYEVVDARARSVLDCTTRSVGS